MEIDDRALKGLACRAVDLWLNLEIGKCRPDSNYQQVVELLRQRFKAEKLNPLLLTLGLLEMALIEDALKGKTYMSDEEREKVIQEVVNSLADNFPRIVEEMEKLLGDISDRIKEFKLYAQKYRAGGEPDVKEG
ncbi:hypothetical protein C7457_0084 [Thermovibrio guaymasensis]|uniref:Uncharacterized protein n=1 Tax=Thermovibrio guaymasensis TaxID=240167 RepID=A0A420W7B9_9BACT|nr:hypothetical protein [Thermovibrio guaymasensis]RKQ63221.1 hypothetical protein C7457_0084 [Thermovibrio guaymasensis]